MSAEQNKQIVREFIDEILNRQRVELVDKFLAPDYKLHFPGAPEPMTRETFPQFVGVFPAAFPDFQIAVETFVADCACATVGAFPSHRLRVRGRSDRVNPRPRSV